jgi:hypothetical protein
MENKFHPGKMVVAKFILGHSLSAAGAGRNPVIKVTAIVTFSIRLTYACWEKVS